MAEYGEIRIPVTVEAEEALSALEALAEALENAGGKAEGAGEGEGRAAEGTHALTQAAGESAAAYLALGQAAMSGFALLLSGADQGAAGTGRMEQAMGRLSQRVAAFVGQRDAVRTLRQMAEEARKNGTAFAQLDPKLQGFIREQGLMGAGMDQVVSALQRQEGAMNQTSAGMAADLTAQRDAWAATKAAIESGAHGELTADGAPLMAQADAAISVLNTLLALLGSSEGASSGGKKGGGGGGSKKSRAAAEAAAAARRAAEEAAKAEREALEEQLRLLERKKRMGEINTREEIAALQRIQARYATNAELRLQMEEKIFEARARLRDEEIAQLDKLNDGILTALRNRYEAQRDLEQKALDASIKAWQDWAGETVAAIQQQIDALDEAEKQESRSEKEQKAQRKIAERKEMLAYTTDAYDRRQLEQEIARLEEEWAKQMSDWARADEKSLLQKEIEAVQARAQAEQEALEQQKSALDSVYDQLTQDASLRAEAEKLLASANQREIIGLIGSYAPDYEATGKTLGERLYQGMASAMGNISAWMDGFISQIAGVQEQAAAAANAVANQYYSGQLTGGLTEAGQPPATTVEQVVNFNVPVEKASDVTRRMEEISEELAAALAG